MIRATDFTSEEDYLTALDEEAAGPASPQQAAREYAYNVGQERPDQAWILTGFDSWEPNPFYKGPPVPHPEADED